MTLEDELHEEMVAAYYRAGKEVGYWGNYYLRSVKKNGGLATAKRMLQTANKGTIQKGLQALMDAGRPDLSLEALVLQPRFASLFTPDELAEAQNRLKAFPQAAFRRPVAPELNFPDTLPDEQTYTEGATRRVTINAFERDNRARAACINKYGIKCAVCDMTFEDMYGDIGKGFIHVHHKKPLAITRGEYTLDPAKDLVPVCPNCHAVLHTSEPPLSIDELKMKINERRG
jgi:5-methylcytosine-specific restriction protein A